MTGIYLIFANFDIIKGGARKWMNLFDICKKQDCKNVREVNFLICVERLAKKCGW